MKNYYFKSFLAACLLATAGISASAQDFSSFYKVTYEGKTVENGGTITSSHWDDDNGWYECDIDFTPTGNFSNVEFEVTGNYTDYPSYQMQNRDPLTWGSPSICWSSGDSGNCVPNQPPLISNFTLNNTDPIQIQFHVLGEEGIAGPGFNPADPSTWPEYVKPANVSNYLLTFAAKVDGEAAGNTFSINVLIGPDNTADGYIPVEPVVSPANGYIGGPEGNITVSWPGVRLKMDSEDKDQKTPVDPSFIEITVNGNPVNIDPNSVGGGKVLVGVQMESDGSSSEWRVDDQLTIQLPDMFFWWKGNVNVTIKEGAVTSVDGAVNAPISLEYTFVDVNNDATWDPAQSEDGSSVVFEKGDAVFYVYWDGYTDISLNPSARPFYQKATDENNGEQQPAASYLSVEDGKVKLDFSSFGNGSYIVCLPQGAVNLDGETVSGEAVYNFTITGSEETVAPNYYVAAKPSEYGYFDAFTVVWADVITQPFELSSKYASVDPNSDNLIFNEEGLSLFKVMKNEVEEVEILQVSIVEYQQNEESENYPYAQLVVTLADFEMDVNSLYSLYIPAGVVDVNYNGETVPNGEVEFSFTLKSTGGFQLPAPKADTAPGKVKVLDTVNISWPSTIGGNDFLNLIGSLDDITVTCNGEIYKDYEVGFSWSSPEAETIGSDGDILTITFPATLADGNYVIAVPAGILNVSDMGEGTFENTPFELKYQLEKETNGVETVTIDAETEVYNVNGVRVGSNGSLDTLPAGLYIINGRKVIVK